MKKQLYLLPLLLMPFFGKSQFWMKTGNPPVGGNGVFPPANNFLGSNSGNTSWIQLGVTGNQDIFIDNLPGAPQLLPANALTPTVLQGGHWIGLGRAFAPSAGLGANTALSPKAHLHIDGGNRSPFAGGFSSGIRPWFQTGTLYTENSNGMYVGLRDLSNVAPNSGLPNTLNSTYAVINWSDDAYGTNGTDFLTFNFTTAQGAGSGGLASTTNGMELARFSPSNNSSGTFGVGNFQIITPAQGGNLVYTEPVRRVEILDADPATGNHPAGGGGGAPQLRLTYAYNSNPSFGIWTEFQTTNNGDMFFNNFNPTFPAILQPRYFGFHKINPANTVEINSNLPSANAQNTLVPASWTGSTGASGLRFSDLNSGSTVVPLTPVVYDPTKVLTVDQNGDVILINNSGGPPTNNGITTLPAANGGPAIQLGVSCNNILNPPGLLAQAALTSSRFIPLNSNNFSFLDGPNGTGRVGIGNINATPCNPGNTLEVGADAGSPYPITPPAGIGTSGLRFSHLTSAFTPIANGVNGVDNTKVLTVDQNGDVVLVTPAGSVPTGCTTINSNIGFVLNNNNFYFDGQGTSNNNVGIGLACGTILPAKLSVLQQSTNANSTAVGIRNLDQDGVAIRAQAFGSWTSINTKVAGWFEAPGSPANATQLALFVPTDGGHISFGFSTPASSPTASLFNINGSGFAQGGIWSTSDSSLKSNITPMGNSIDKIIQLQPVTFTWDTVRDSLMMGTHAGFIAQQVNSIIPEVVRNVQNGIKGISYSELIPYVVKGMQEQQLSIDSLRANAGGGSSVPVAGSGLSVNSSSVELGGPVGNGSYLNTDREIIGLDKTLHFTNSAQLSLNFTPGGAPKAALNVRPSHGSTYVNTGDVGIYTLMDYNQGVQNYGNIIEVTSQGGEIGLYAKSTGLTKFGNTGVIGHSIGGANGAANGANGSSYYPFIGVQGISEGYYDGSNYTRSIGGWFEANTIANNNIGVYATAPSSQGGQQNNWAGYFNGDVYLTGSAYFQGGPTVSSDQTLKTNIDTIANATQIIKKLKPRSFYYDTTNNYGLSFSGKKQYGLIAQDVQLVLPELVSTINKPADTDTAGNVIHQAKVYKSLNYNAFISLLIKTVQEQQRTIDSLKNHNKSKDSIQDARLTALENNMDNCCQHHNNGNGLGKSSANNIDVELNNADIIVLNQNTPNPFAEQTFITYNIPQNISAAQILFYDINGRNIKTVDITRKGPGQLNVYANDLTNGVYSYTLIADGKIIDTKKMVKQQ